MPIQKKRARRKTVRSKRHVVKRKLFGRRRSKSIKTLNYKPTAGLTRQPFPPTLYTVLTYSDSLSLTQNLAGVPVEQTYRINSCYQPKSGVNVRPRFFDTLCGANNTVCPYLRYRVHAARAIVQFFPPDLSIPTIGYVLMRNSTASAMTSIREIQERVMCKRCYLGSSTIGALAPRTVTNFAKSKVLLGVKDLRDEDNAYALYNSDPGRLLYVDVGMGSVNTAMSAEAVFVNVTIQYFVEFFVLNDVADSVTP